MPQGKTAYEILCEWWTGKPAHTPIEQRYANPLNAKIFSRVRLLKMAGLDNHLWTITAIWSWDRIVNGVKCPMTDYYLESDNKTLIIRLLPAPERKPAVAMLMLSQHYPETDTEHGHIDPLVWCDESPEIIAGLMDQKGELVHNAGSPDEERYHRDICNTNCTVYVIRDVDDNKEIEESDVTQENYSLWTFRRDTEDAGGKVIQHLHAQLGGQYHAGTQKITNGNRTLLILRGEEIPVENVVIY